MALRIKAKDNLTRAKSLLFQDQKRGVSGQNANQDIKIQ
jgi:hypothetical protein